MSQGMISCPDKVVLLVHEGIHGGGGSRQSLYILEALIREGTLPVLVSNAKDSWLGQQIREKELTVKTYYSSAIKREINPIRELMVLFFLIRVFLIEKPDIMLACGVKLIGLGSVAGWLCRIPKRIAIIRGQGAEAGSWMLKIIYWMERFVAWSGTRFITVCNYNREEMIKLGICKPSDIITIHNGTVPFPLTPTLPLKGEGAAVGETSKRSSLTDAGGGDKPDLLHNPLSYRSIYNIPEDAFVLGMVGRLYRQKRFDQFIQLMTRLCERNPNVYGMIIGEGKDRMRLQQQIDSSGYSERIFITGFIIEMSDIYADLDLSILFSRYEGFANALLESAAAGIPIIADAVCGNSEIVIHGENGYIVSPGDIAQAAVYAETLIHDPVLCREMGKRGQELIETRFNLDIQIKKLIEAIKQWPSDTRSGP